MTYKESEIKEIFFSVFFWVAESRPDWLKEVVNLKKAQLAGDLNAKAKIEKLIDVNYTGGPTRT